MYRAKMIRENVERFRKNSDDFRALQVIISVPEGKNWQSIHFNPRLGDHRRHFNPWNGAGL